MRASHLLLGFGLTLCVSAARADVTHVGTNDPPTEDWTAVFSGTGVTSGPLADPDFALPAWRIDDPSSAAGSARAFQAPASELPDSTDYWTLTARLRVRGLNDAPDLGVFLEVTDTSHRRYLALLGTTLFGGLRIILSSDGTPTGSEYPSGPVQANRSDYAWVELAHAPGSTAVSLFVNGVLQTNSYDGFAAPAVPARILWGAGSSANQGEGYYNFIRFTKGSPQACGNGGDDDGDLLVDLADPDCASALDPREDGPVIPCDDGVDTDGDGICDADEPEVGTHPAQADSDDDGLADGAEFGGGADPLDPDSDADGLADGPEVATYGSDPVTADSDGDGLADGAEAAIEVFVTKSSHTGNLGGLAGGDAICLAEAQAQNLLRADGARAWLSDASQDAIDRVPDGPYRSRALGHAIAKNKADLTDGALLLKILLSGPSVWTGTSASGVSFLYHCDSWSESAPSGNAVAGIPYEELGWTDGNQPSCEQTLPLYCFVPAVGSDPTEVDTDGDGFDDGVEVAAGTDPVDAGDPPPAVPALPAAGLGLLAGALALMSASAARASRRSRS